jgi:hypothetical protein
MCGSGVTVPLILNLCTDVDVSGQLLALAGLFVKKEPSAATGKRLGVTTGHAFEESILPLSGIEPQLFRLSRP